MLSWYLALLENINTLTARPEPLGLVGLELARLGALLAIAKQVSLPDERGPPSSAEPRPS